MYEGEAEQTEGNCHERKASIQSLKTRHEKNAGGVVTLSMGFAILKEQEGRMEEHTAEIQSNSENS